MTETIVFADRRTHELRYTLKDTVTGDVYFVVVFTLILREDVEKEEAQEGEKYKNTKEPEAASAAPATSDFQPSADDLD